MLRFITISGIAVALVATGCQAYQFGASTLYRFDVRTVNVAVIESNSYRRWLGPRLTEAVVKQIGLSTPYQLADESSADSFLRGRIVRELKRVISETREDDPRTLEVEYRIEVTWTDRAGAPLMPRSVLRIDRNANFIPEAGQSIVTAEQELIDRLARQIVQQMESPW